MNWWFLISNETTSKILHLTSVRISSGHLTSDIHRPGIVRRICQRQKEKEYRILNLEFWMLNWWLMIFDVRSSWQYIKNLTSDIHTDFLWSSDILHQQAWHRPIPIPKAFGIGMPASKGKENIECWISNIEYRISNFELGLMINDWWFLICGTDLASSKRKKNIEYRISNRRILNWDWRLTMYELVIFDI